MNTKFRRCPTVYVLLYALNYIYYYNNWLFSKFSDEELEGWVVTKVFEIFLLWHVTVFEHSVICATVAHVHAKIVYIIMSRTTLLSLLVELCSIWCELLESIQMGQIDCPTYYTCILFYGAIPLLLSGINRSCINQGQIARDDERLWRWTLRTSECTLAQIQVKWRALCHSHSSTTSHSEHEIALYGHRWWQRVHSWFGYVHLSI